MPRPTVLLLALAACAVAPPPPAAAPRVLPSATRDFDSDGFPDPRDRCPREPGPEPLGCPELDPDKDTFTTSYDRCPDVAGVAPDGCPPPDADADGVPDDLDKCADGLETRNGFDDTDGCPDKLPKDLARIIGPNIKGIHFAAARDALQPRSNATLARVAAVLKRYPSVRLAVTGHGATCEPDKDLPQRRAQAIKQQLVDRGIDPARLETRGACLDRPPAAPKPAKAPPRSRVEFALLVQ